MVATFKLYVQYLSPALLIFCSSSSDDELDFTIHCANQRGMRVRHSSVSSKGSSAESDFEKEMNEELNQRVSALEEARKSGFTGQKEKGGHKSLN